MLLHQTPNYYLNNEKTIESGYGYHGDGHPNIV